jgi:hypothetical protein
MLDSPPFATPGTHAGALIRTRAECGTARFSCRESRLVDRVMSVVKMNKDLPSYPALQHAVSLDLCAPSGMVWRPRIPRERGSRPI